MIAILARKFKQFLIELNLSRFARQIRLFVTFSNLCVCKTYFSRNSGMCIFFLRNWAIIVNFSRAVAEIKYAKPKRGKTAQGVWKDIVNVNDYTQTLRMEKCMWVILKQNSFCNNEINFCYCRKPGGQCSYVSHHYKSQCSQVYNYHRLLSWDKERGLHMDIYKVCY